MRSGSGTPGTLIPHAHARVKPRKDGTHLPERLVRPEGEHGHTSCLLRRGVDLGGLRGPQDGAGRHEAGLEVAPESDHEFAGQGGDGDFADATLGVADPVAIPAGERTLGLIAHPEPGELEGSVAGPGIAGSADALLAHRLAAVVRGAGEAEIGAELTPVAEVAVEDLVDQEGRPGWSHAFEPQQQGDLGLRRTGLGLLDRRARWPRL